MKRKASDSEQRNDKRVCQRCESFTNGDLTNAIVLTSGTHRRLGANSPVSILSQYELMEICALVIPKYLYMLDAGGKRGCSESRFGRKDMSNLQAFTWDKLPNPSITRTMYGIDSLQRSLYVFGGENKAGIIMDHCERYSVDEAKWHTIEPMIWALSGPKAISMHRHGMPGCILVIGGATKYCSVRNVQRYNTIEDKWYEDEPMNVARSVFAVGAHLDKVWVAGGWSKHIFFRSSVEYRDFQTGKWHEINTNPSLGEFKSTVTSTMVGSKLYVCGRIFSVLDVSKADGGQLGWSKASLAPNEICTASMVGSETDNVIYALTITGKLWMYVNDKWTPLDIDRARFEYAGLFII